MIKILQVPIKEPVVLKNPIEYDQPEARPNSPVDISESLLKSFELLK